MILITQILQADSHSNYAKPILVYFISEYNISSVSFLSVYMHLGVANNFKKMDRATSCPSLDKKIDDEMYSCELV